MKLNWKAAVGAIALAVPGVASAEVVTLDDGTKFDINDGEVIIVTDTCPAGYTMTTGGCFMSGGSGSSITPPPGATVPGQTGGFGGSQPPPPPPKKPTEAQCKAALSDCNKAADKAHLACRSAAELRAAQKVMQFLTCHGNDLDLWNGIQVGKSFWGQFWDYPNTTRACTPGDKTGSSDASSACRVEFWASAYMQCIYGSNDKSLSNSLSVSAGMDFDGFGNLGVSSNFSETTSIAGKSGAFEACAEAANKNEARCEEASKACDSKAKGTATATLAPTSLPVLLQQIDRVKLGLSTNTGSGHLGNPGVGVLVITPGTFRDTPQRPDELTHRYYDRIRFLARWSRFLQMEGTSATVQKAAQVSFENAQRAFTKLLVEYLAMSLRAHIQNPFKPVSYFTAWKSAYAEYMKDDVFRVKAEAIEAGLMQALGTHLGASIRDRFKTEVWPGIGAYGFASPMQPSPMTNAPIAR